VSEVKRLTLPDLPDFVANPNPGIYQTGVPLFVDFETTNIKKGSARDPANKIVLACWKHGWDGEIEESWDGEFAQTALLQAISKSDFVVAHNAKFELQWLVRCGLDIENVLVYDTMLAEYVIGGNRWKTGNLSLDEIVKRRRLGSKGQLVSRMIKAGISPEDIPKEWLLRYCRMDVDLLPRLMNAQSTDMEGTRLLPVVYSRCMLTPVLADIENNGMMLDREKVTPLWEQAERELATVESKTAKFAAGVNMASPKQVAAFLYDKLKFDEPTVRRGKKVLPDRTASGGRKTDGDTVAALAPITDDQRQFKELFEVTREWSSQLTKYLRKFKECIDEAEGMLHGNFNQTQTFTHRLSSSGSDYKVQFQNFPRAYKNLFTAPDDWLVGEVDGSQLEFRVAGHLGRDESVLADVEDKVDVHRFTADTLTGAGQPTDRQGAKEHTFKPLYGGSSGTTAEQAYYQAFKRRYPGVARAQQEWINRVLLEKKLETEWGLVYYWPDTRMDASGYIRNTTSICNYPVQGFATAEIIPLALVCMWHRLKRSSLRMRLVNTIHDSIIAYLPPDEVEAFHELSKQTMIYDVYSLLDKLYGIQFTIPLGCGVKVSKNWGEGEEHKYEAPRNLYKKKEETASEHPRNSKQDVREGMERAGRGRDPALVPAKRGQPILPHRDGQGCEPRGLHHV
jgi:DNA polymerase I-like protein with 3'-5' exonuclease and polymerase domains